MDNTKSIPSGALKAIINYGEVLGKLDDTSINYSKEFNKESIRDIHKAFSNLLKEESVCIDEDTFDLLCNAPFQSCWGRDLYPNVYIKAAKVMEGFATHQVFTNGNKRLAVGATMQFLKSQNIEFEMNQKDIYEFVMDVANKKIGNPNKDIVINDVTVSHHIFKIANIIRNNSVELEIEVTKNCIPVGSAKDFNKEEYNDFKNNEFDNNLKSKEQENVEENIQR